MDINEKIKIMQHYADGGEVEQIIGGSEGWVKSICPTWNWSGNAYRIKPEPTPQSLEDLIKAEYPDYEVKMIKDNGYGILSHNGDTAYTQAKAYIDFVSYVYQDGEGLFQTCSSSMFYGSVISRPVAALFKKELEQND